MLQINHKLLWKILLRTGICCVSCLYFLRGTSRSTKIDELLETFQKIIKFGWGVGGGPLHIPCRNNRVERSSRRKPVWVVISNADKFGFLAEQGWLVGNWERSSSH